MEKALNPAHLHARPYRRLTGIAMWLLGIGAMVFSPEALYAQATGWPARPVRVLVGYPAGGANDLVARAVAGRLGESLKQSFVV